MPVWYRLPSPNASQLPPWHCVKHNRNIMFKGTELLQATWLVLFVMQFVLARDALHGERLLAVAHSNQTLETAAETACGILLFVKQHSDHLCEDWFLDVTC